MSPSRDLTAAERLLLTAFRRLPQREQIKLLRQVLQARRKPVSS